LQQGDVLTAANTLADADGLGAITYTWKAGTTTVGTGTSYTLAQADVGKAISVVIRLGVHACQTTCAPRRFNKWADSRTKCNFD